LKEISVIGGGLAGCEAAWQASKMGAKVTIFEMKPSKFSPAHKTEGLAELVCSNSLRSDVLHNAAGLLKEEMRLFGSIVMEAAEATRVPAGSALAVDRVSFSDYITLKLSQRKNVEIVRKEIDNIPEFDENRVTVIASGPLTSKNLSDAIADLVGEEYFYFYDAVSPVINADSIDFNVAFRQSRYSEEDKAYINCPLNKDQYNSFVAELLSSKKVGTKDFEKALFFEGCMPIEEMASRGRETLAHGPMKPVGISDPETGKRFYAVVQLRQEDKNGSMYNMVGFQTRLIHSEQKRIFRMIPGLEHAEFLRLGSMHRNTYINSPAHLSTTTLLKTRPDILFAGQITGVEGYIESAATGIIAGINASLLAGGKTPVTPPSSTATGGLLKHITESDPKTFQPMNVNFGLIPQTEVKKGRKLKRAERRKSVSLTAINDMKKWIDKELRFNHSTDRA